MKRSAKSSVVVGFLALVAAGCGSGSSDSKAQAQPSATSTPTAAATPAVSVQVLKAALLGVSAFPTGWRSTPVSSDNNDSKKSGDCGDRLEAFDKANPDNKTKVEADFEKDSDEIDEELSSYVAVTDLQRQVADFTGIVRGCSKLILEADGKKVTLNVGELSFPKMGDESFGLSATGKINDIPVELNYVLIRRGTVLMQLTQTAVLSADIEMLADIARKGIAKVDAVVPPTK